MSRKIIFAPLTHFRKDSLQKLSCYKKGNKILMAFWFLNKPLTDPFALKTEEHGDMDYSFLLTGKKLVCPFD